MQYAVIKTGGKQHKVSEGEEILVDKLCVKEGSQIDFPEVLLVRRDNEVAIGDPLVKEGKVTGKVIGIVKGKKIRVSKFKAKVRYRRTIGFRPLYTKVLIEKIILGKEEKKIRRREKSSASSVDSLDSREKKS